MSTKHVNSMHKPIEWREGADAYAAGDSRTANPYRWTHERCKDWSAAELERETEAFVQWVRGYEYAEDCDSDSDD